MPAWSDSERNKMFLAMIELMAPHGSNNKLPSWTLVAERMASGFTGEAVRQQFQKCRKEGLPRQIPLRNQKGANASAAGNAHNNYPLSAHHTASAANAKYSFSRGSGKRCQVNDFGDDDEEASLYAMSKKRIKKEKIEGKVMMGGLGLPTTDGYGGYGPGMAEGSGMGAVGGGMGMNMGMQGMGHGGLPLVKMERNEEEDQGAITGAGAGMLTALQLRTGSSD